MGRHSLRDDITDAFIGRHAGRQVLALDRLLDRAEGAAIAAAVGKTQQVTDIAWPPAEADEDLLTRTDEPL